jgi:hypothetical protein
MSEWKKPEEFNIPDPFGFGTLVMLKMDYGVGPFETVGRAYVTGAPGDRFPVFATDGGGWCTPYVIGWRVARKTQQETEPTDNT